jgi:hypothetical protein
MNKTVYFVVVFFAMAAWQGHGQHKVNDIKQYKGWYKINVETDSNNELCFSITQCYPNGDEYVVSSNERQKLPLHLKIVCIGISEILKDQMEALTFNEDGIYMKITGFTFVVDFSMSEEDMLESLGEELVNRYKYSDW